MKKMAGNKEKVMRSERKYSSYADFERDEYLRVMSFYENLEDIMDDEFFSIGDTNKPRKNQRDEVIEDLEF